MSRNAGQGNICIKYTEWLWLVVIGTLMIILAVAPNSEKIRIVVINLDTSANLPMSISEEISGHLRTHLSHLPQFDVMDNSEMTELLNKQSFLRPKGCNSIECHPTLFDTHGTLQFLQKCGASDYDAALEIGWMLGVEKVLIGLVNELSGRYTISVKIIDTMTREVDVTDQIDVHFEGHEIEKRVEELTVRLSEKIKKHSHDMYPSVKGTVKSPLQAGRQRLDMGDVGEIKDMDDFVRFVQKKMGDEHDPNSLKQWDDGDQCKSATIQSSSKGIGHLTEMILIPAGAFKMGSEKSEEECPVHEVYLDAFYIDQYEVTNAQYEIFMKVTDHRPPITWGKPGFNEPDQPVTGVSWEDAAEYAAWVGKRLPTEAEWEKAARGVDSRMFPWGNQWKEGMCRSAGKKTPLGPASVGSYPGGSSPYGCHDMAGNVWEWCSDWFMPDYYSQSAYRNPKGPIEGSWHVLRGGGWKSAPNEVRTTLRQWGCPEGGYRCAGFRCARDVNGQGEGT